VKTITNCENMQGMQGPKGGEIMSMTAALNVNGMTCGHCKATVEKAVSAVDGVSEVAVDLAAKTVTVSYDPDKTGEANLKRAIEDQGYSVL